MEVGQLSTHLYSFPQNHVRASADFGVLVTISMHADAATIMSHPDLTVRRENIRV